jgi:hypothetical protein
MTNVRLRALRCPLALPMMEPTIRFPTNSSKDQIELTINLHGKDLEPPMSAALGQKQTFGPFITMSALPPKADIAERDRHVRFVPKADIAPQKSIIQSPWHAFQ